MVVVFWWFLCGVGGGFCVDGDGFCVGGDGNKVVVAVFSLSRSRYCVSGGGLCLSLVVAAGLGLHFLKIDFLHPTPNARNNFLV